MPDRIVVSFRGLVPPEEGAGARYLTLAMAFKKRAEALGATLCAWSAQTFSFDLARDDLEEALGLAELVRSSNVEDRFGVGVAEGELQPVAEAGSFASLSWGQALLVAVGLSRDARPGEVLLGPRFAEHRSEELARLGYRVVLDPPRRAWVLVHDQEEEPERMSEPPRPPTVPPVLPPPPTTPRPSRPPSMPPRSPEGEALAELARKALVQGDVGAVEKLLDQLRQIGEHTELVERMAGIVALQRGATGDALKRLRGAAEAYQAPAQRARARLAYAVALAAAGRHERSLLEALDALARAREAADSLGEHACARFLARLSAATGHADAAAVWARVAAIE
jgi:hypothetical protein